MAQSQPAYKRFFKQYMPFIVALLPVLFLRDFTPNNELRYISVALEALREHHFFALYLQGEPYVEFPPLYFWLLMLSKVVFRHWYMVQLAMFSLIPALLIVHYMNRWVCRYEMGGMRMSDGSQSRDLAQWMLFTCGLMFFMSFFLRMDMLFCLWIVLALYNFWQILYEPLGPNQESGLKERQRPSVRHQWYFGIFVFLACFTKGLWGVAIPFVTTLIYMLISGRIHRIFHLWSWRSLLVLATGVGLWWLGTYYEAGPEYCRHMFEQQSYTPLIYTLRHHRPWFYYVGSVWYDTLPWGPMCLVLLIVSLWRNRGRLSTPLQNFFAIVFLSTLVFLSCMPGKIDVRLLPVFPFLIYVGVMQLGQWQWPLVWQWRMLWVCRVILILIFLCGMCITSDMNAHLGCYGHLCWKANAVRRQYHTEEVYVWALPQMSNMDVYLHRDPIRAQYEDLSQQRLHNTVLLTSEEEWVRLQPRLDKDGVPAEGRGKIMAEVGPYLVLKFD